MHARDDSSSPLGGDYQIADAHTAPSCMAHVSASVTSSDTVKTVIAIPIVINTGFIC